MRDPNKLRCPSCGADFSILKITERAVQCPACAHEMFVFREGDEPLSRGRLYARIDGSRNLYVKAVQPWLHPDRFASAPMLLGYLSSVIADQLEE